MNAPHPIPPRRDRQADRAEAERLVGELYKQVSLVNEAAERETSTVALAELVRLSTDLRFAADLLYAYQAGLAVAEPDPVTGCYLVERIAVAIDLPKTGHWVMAWEPALGVTHWAHRPGVEA